MLESTLTLLRTAQDSGYAVGAFNVYNLEGVLAVVAAAQAQRSPAILQLHPGALAVGGLPLVDLCLAASRQATVPLSVHLDHATSLSDIEAALLAGCRSIMADASHLPFDQNMAFIRQATVLARKQSAVLEAELGRLAGTEDGLTVAEYEAHLTNPAQAADFVTKTGLDALAVCIGNIHGHYNHPPQLDFERLAAIRQVTPALLVLHGASGLPRDQIARSIALGVCKFNVNTEVRAAYIDTLRATLAAATPPDLANLMQHAIAAMQTVIEEKIQLFGSNGRA